VAVLGVFVGALSSMIDNMNHAAFSISSGLQAQECAGLIDSMTSNDGVEFSSGGFSCIVREGEVVSTKNGIEKSEKPLNRGIEFATKNAEKIPVIVVKGRRHYEE
jgi:hypothetical protein